MTTTFDLFRALDGARRHQIPITLTATSPGGQSLMPVLGFVVRLDSDGVTIASPVTSFRIPLALIVSVTRPGGRALWPRASREERAA